MKDLDIEKVVTLMKHEVNKWRIPIVSEIAKNGRDPFRILISTILSLRTKDETTRKASQRLFSIADNVYDMAKLSEKEIEHLIYPVGFFRNKSKVIVELSNVLIEKYNGIVPDELDELLTLRGVGRKTANLVVTIGYGKPGICVDIHVHRVSNRLGYVKTKTPDETELVLRKKLPHKY
ncbi:MAG: endonuclease III, partial [Thermodesulfobacteriota bacterium]|nr:endonuclease III [Thermodesulfobacteriota bacterium]